MAAENSPAITVPVTAPTSTSPNANTNVNTSPLPPRAGWVRWAFAAVGLAAAAAAVAAFDASKPAASALRTTAASAQPARLAPAPASGAKPAPNEPAQPAAIALDVRTDPPGALLSVDGVPVGSTRAFPRDGGKHRLSISAAGFEPHSQDVTFDRDSSLSVALRPVRAKAGPVGSVRAAARGPAPPISTRPATAPSPRLDEESPYSR